MQRTFQAKPNIKQYVLLAVLLSVVVCFYWIPMSRPLLGALLFLLFNFMIVVVSRMLQTTYVIHTEGFLEIKKGRFATDVKISLSDVKQVDKVRRSGTLVIVLNEGKELYLIPPKNEEDFLKCIEKYRP